MPLIWVNGCNIFTLMSVTAVASFRYVSKVRLFEHREDALKVIHRTLSPRLSCLLLFHQNGLKKFIFFFPPQLQFRPETSFSSLSSFDKKHSAFLKNPRGKSSLPTSGPFIKVLTCEDLSERRLLELTFLAAAWQVTASLMWIWFSCLEKQEKGEEFQHPPATHPRQLPQTVSWGPRIRTLPEAASGTWKKPSVLGAMSQPCCYAPCGENICEEAPASPAARRWGDGISGKFLTACAPEESGTSCPRETEKAGETSEVFRSMGRLVQLRDSRSQKVSI